jgi:2-amino-4-hydroxy-6-hydroxymethyldihydropteridine diphosphokinase
LVKLVLGLGSNVGNRVRYLKKAIKEISSVPGLKYIALSPVYETDPWGFKEQKKFLNCVLVCSCSLEPGAVLKLLKQTEKSLGRMYRGKWKQREIDIDILFFGNKIIKKGKLIVPHPFLQERNFVLKPLSDIMPGFIHPVFSRTIKYLFKHSPDKGKLKLYSEKL